jgi:MraZ protein
LRHAVLYGEYEISFDSKNRVLLPAEIRRAIQPERDGEALFLVVGINRVPWLYPEKYYEELVTRDPADVTPDDESLAFDQMRFAMAHRLEPDKQGRVLIPEKVLKRIGIEKEVTLIGVNDHLELWDRKAWERRREELISRSSEIALKAKLARVQNREQSREERNN